MWRYVEVLLSPFTQHPNNSTMVGVWWHRLSAIFWSPVIWLPPGVEWKDLESTDEVRYTNFSDVCVYPPILSIALLGFYFFCMKPFVLEPLAKLAGLPSKRPYPPPHNKDLTALYLHCGRKPSEGELSQAVDSTGMSRRQVERWLRRQHATSQTTKHEKFVECGFHLICHSFITIFGCSVMFYEPWAWNIVLCWEDFPYHSISDGVWWYFIFGLSYYWAATFLQIQAPGRSMGDKLHMILHHMFSLFLMTFSWTCNFWRIGTLVLIVHEVGDIPLLSAKMFSYADITAPKDGLFVVFLVTWVITRCYLFPFWILRSVYEDSSHLTGMPIALMMKGVAIGLLVLDIVWTILIGRVLVRKLSSGSLEDVRSGDEELSDDETTHERKDD